MRIGLIGKIGSGKTTCASIMVDRLGHSISKRTSLAKRLKELCHELFPMLKTKKDRKMFITFGEKMREIDENVWVRSVLKEIQNNPNIKHWVVDDVRRENEYNILKENGFIFVRLNVNEHIRQLRLLKLYKEDVNTQHTIFDNHITETELSNTIVDYTFGINEFNEINQKKQLEKCVDDFLSTTCHQKNNNYMQLPIP
tara:strand:+ start:36 stop:629 length:594 start_codon:yes stop_codon:yes gene_type:complete